LKIPNFKIKIDKQAGKVHWSTKVTTLLLLLLLLLMMMMMMMETCKGHIP
jgi:hypothetical protein